MKLRPLEIVGLVALGLASTYAVVCAILVTLVLLSTSDSTAACREFILQ